MHWRALEKLSKVLEENASLPRSTSS